jgi:hypothetical protein
MVNIIVVISINVKSHVNIVAVIASLIIHFSMKNIYVNTKDAFRNALCVEGLAWKLIIIPEKKDLSTFVKIFILVKNLVMHLEYVFGNI